MFFSKYISQVNNTLNPNLNIVYWFLTVNLFMWQPTLFVYIYIASFTKFCLLFTRSEICRHFFFFSYHFISADSRVLLVLFQLCTFFMSSFLPRFTPCILLYSLMEDDHFWLKYSWPIGPTAITDLSRASGSNVTFLRRHRHQSHSKVLEKNIKFELGQTELCSSLP